MKVCPKCGGINEENQATKCLICGQSLMQEPVYTKEQLEDAAFATSLLTNIHHKNKRRQRIHKLRISLQVILVIVCLFFIFRYLELGPKGYIEIKETEITIRVGETCFIKPNYSKGIKARHVGINYDDYGNKNTTYPITISIQDNGFLIHALKVETFIISFNVRSNAEQEDYNQELKLIILPAKGHVSLPETTWTMVVGETKTIVPICSDYLNLSNILYRVTPQVSGVKIIYQPTGFKITALEPGIYVITFLVEEPDDLQQFHPNQLTITIVEVA